MLVGAGRNLFPRLFSQGAPRCSILFAQTQPVILQLCYEVHQVLVILRHDWFSRRLLAEDIPCLLKHLWSLLSEPSQFRFSLEPLPRFLSCFGDALDVDSPASQFGSEPCILAFPANSQRELVVRHDHNSCAALVGVIIEKYCTHAGWAEGLRDKDRLIRAPLDDIDFLAVELLDNALNTHTAHADARANRVRTLLNGRHCHLRSCARLAGDALNLNRAIVDLGHFIFEQPAQHAAVCAADNNLRAPAGTLDFHHVRAHFVVRPVFLTRHLLVARQDCFRTSQANRDDPTGTALYGPGDEIAHVSRSTSAGSGARWVDISPAP